MNSVELVTPSKPELNQVSEDVWVPPTIEAARENKRLRIFGEGKASFCSTNAIHASDLSVGISLYFQFLKSILVYMLICSIISIPAIMFAFYGQGIPDEKKDATNLYRFTLGNIGYNPSSPTFDTDSKCHFILNQATNSSCVHLLGFELTIEQVTAILTASEFLQVLFFFLFLAYLSNSVPNLKIEKEVNSISVSDFTIMVTNLPRDTQEMDLVQHFSSLYPLDVRDWRHRFPLKDAAPVPFSSPQNSPRGPQTKPKSSTIDHLFPGTWVADCHIHRKIGNFISTYQDQQALLNRLNRSKALMRMYSPSTLHGLGPNPKKFDQAKDQMLQCAKKVDQLTQSLMEKHGMRVQTVKRERRQSVSTHASSLTLPRFALHSSTVVPLSPSANQQSQHSDQPIPAPDPQVQVITVTKEETLELDAEPVAAFITFQYCESYARCLEDHARYSSFPFTLCCYPRKLLFRNHKLHIMKAPEPDAILWENLEISPLSRLLRSALTSIVTLILVLVCFFIVLQTSEYQKKFSATIPDLSVCSSSLPLMYLNESSFESTPLSRFVLSDPPKSDTSLVPGWQETKSTLDSICSSYFPNSVFSEFTERGNFSHPVAGYSFDACSSSRWVYLSPGEPPSSSEGLCPHFGQSEFCPCVTTKSNQMCRNCDQVPTAAPVVPPSPPNSTSPYPDNCPLFPAQTIGYCFCLSRLQLMIAQDGILKTLRSLVYMPKSDICGSFFIDYSKAISMTYMSIIMTALVNSLLVLTLNALNSFERHAFVDQSQGAQIFKLFLSTYINMSFLILVASGRLKNNNEILQQTHVLQGSFPDFTRDWYGNVGTYFLTTFVIQSLTPLFYPLLDYWFFKPLMRLWFYPSIRKFRSVSKITQSEVDALELGPVYDPTLNQAQFLALFFFSMTYAAGLTIVVPFTAFAFLLYFLFEKYLLFRYFEKPPNTEEGVIVMILKVLPYAAMIRLAVSCWMFGYSDILSSKIIVTPSTTTSVNGSPQGISNVSSAPDIFARYGYGLSWLFSKSSSHVPDLIYFAFQRISKPQVFPLFCFLVLILAVKLFRFLWKRLPTYLILKAIGKLYSLLFQRKIKIADALDRSGQLVDYNLHQLAHPLRKESAPFTETYFKYFTNSLHRFQNKGSLFSLCRFSNPFSLSAREAEEGWVVKPRGENDKYLTKVKRVSHSASSEYQVEEGEGPVSDRDLMKTFEIIQERGCASYRLEHIPAYLMVSEALKQGLKMAKLSESGVVDYLERATAHGGSEPVQQTSTHLEEPLQSRPNDPFSPDSSHPQHSHHSPRSPRSHPAQTSSHPHSHSRSPHHTPRNTAPQPIPVLPTPTTSTPQGSPNHQHSNPNHNQNNNNHPPHSPRTSTGPPVILPAPQHVQTHHDSPLPTSLPALAPPHSLHLPSPSVSPRIPTLDSIPSPTASTPLFAHVSTHSPQPSLGLSNPSPGPVIIVHEV